MIRREGLDELEVGVAEVEVRQADGAIVDHLGTNDRETELVAPRL